MDQETPRRLSNPVETEQHPSSPLEQTEPVPTDIQAPPSTTEIDALPQQTPNSLGAEQHPTSQSERTETPSTDIQSPQSTTETDTLPQETSNSLGPEQHSTSPLLQTEPVPTDIQAPPSTTETNALPQPTPNSLGGEQHPTSPLEQTEPMLTNIHSPPSAPETNTLLQQTPSSLGAEQHTTPQAERDESALSSFQIGSSSTSSLENTSPVQTPNSKELPVSTTAGSDPSLTVYFPPQTHMPTFNSLPQDTDNRTEPAKDEKSPISVITSSSPILDPRRSQTPTDVLLPEPPGQTHHFGKNDPTKKGYQKPISKPKKTSPSEPKSKRPSGTIIDRLTRGHPNKFVTLCFVIAILIIATIALVISILEIIFGKKYYNQCSADPDIPSQLYSAGILTLFTTVLAIVTSAALGSISSEGRKTNKITKIMPRIIRIILVVAHILLVIFLISLIYNTFRIFKTVQYDRMEEAATYCHKKLYRFTAIISILHIINTVLLCCCALGLPDKQ